ncbi:MAG: transglutaminase-like domain-containing protein [Actinomycetota bacterium]|nr:transglutaminase-like domain-containing protein [Actinomycetota bacterium]
MTAASRAAFAAVVRADPVDLARACLLLAQEADPGLDPDAFLSDLDALAAAAGPHVRGRQEPRDLAEGLQRALGDEAGFSGVAQEAPDLRSSLLHEVLKRRRGLPILLSVVWLEVARRLGVPAHGVGLPGHFVVGVGEPGQAQLVDPFHGGRLLAREEADAQVRSLTGRGLVRSDLEPTPPDTLLLRVLTNIRALSARPDPSLASTRTHLWSVELALLLPRHPAALRRERGEVLGRLGRFSEGGDELRAYADAVRAVDPETALAVERAARALRARLN